MKQPCLDCGKPAEATRCGGCQSRQPPRHYRNRGGRPQYGGDYKRRGEAIRGIGVCWICGQPGRPDDPIQADHLAPAAVFNGRGGEGGLAPAHRSCNIRRAHQVRKAQRRAAEKAELDRRLKRDR